MQQLLNTAVIPRHRGIFQHGGMNGTFPEHKESDLC